LERLEIIASDELLQKDKFKSIEKIINQTGEDIFLIGVPQVFSFQYVSSVRGKQQALLDIMEKPDFVRKIIDKATDISIQQAIALTELGADALYIGETFGGLIGPRFFEEFCAPAFKKFVDVLKKYDVLIYLHICGDSTRLFELMVDTGVDCIEPLDPLGGVRVADAKRRIGHRAALMGGVNTLLLAHGSLQEVVDDCHRCLEEGAPGGGYILAAGDMLPTETSAQKVEAMVNAAKNYGYQ